MSKQIGSVEIKRLRVYPVDWRDPEGSADVAVEPGIFPVMRSGDRIWWPMRGRLSHHVPGSFECLGPGLFASNSPYDDLSEESVSFTSREFTPAQFADLLTEPHCQDGPEQRLAIKLFESFEVAS